MSYTANDTITCSKWYELDPKPDTYSIRRVTYQLELSCKIKIKLQDSQTLSQTRPRNNFQITLAAFACLGISWPRRVQGHLTASKQGPWWPEHFYQKRTSSNCTAFITTKQTEELSNKMERIRRLTQSAHVESAMIFF